MYRLHAILPLVFGPSHGWGHVGPWWLWGPAFVGSWIVLVAVITLTVCLVNRRSQHYVSPSQVPSGIDQARAILAERLARGEIGVEEYDDRVSHLQP